MMYFLPHCHVHNVLNIALIFFIQMDSSLGFEKGTILFFIWYHKMSSWVCSYMDISWCYNIGGILINTKCLAFTIMYYFFTLVYSETFLYLYLSVLTSSSLVPEC